MDEYDLAIVGSGPGGYVAAVRASQLGLKTVCIEKEKSFGGTCLNVGCIPSKALLQSTEHFTFAQNKAKEHGIKLSSVKPDWKQMQKRKKEIVEGLTGNVADLLKRKGVDTIHGKASFTSPNTLKAGNEEVKAKHFLLATGSLPIELPPFPFDEKKIVSSTGALSLKKVPKTMAVIGAGVIGVELASVYSRLGSKVSVYEMLDHICPSMDAQVSKEFQKILASQGPEFHLSTKADPEKIDAEVILVAVGRQPNTDGLELEKAGVEKNDQGFVEINGRFQTNVPHIYAIGDLVEGPMLAHKASEEGIAAVEIIAGRRPHVNYMAIPNVIYTHPEVASVGLTEEEGKEHDLEMIKGVCSYKANPRARCAGDTDGFVKVLGEKSTGRLIGMHIIGPHASELIGEGMVALEKGMTVEDLATAPHAHPTLSEAIMEAAQKALGRAIHL